VNVPNSFKITYRLFRGDTSDSDPSFTKINGLRIPCGASATGTGESSGVLMKNESDFSDNQNN